MTSDRAKRVLVIDDESAIRRFVCEYLGLLGFEANGAANGAEGLAMFDRAPYDLVITDLLMPGMTGWEVSEAVRIRAPEVGVILASGSAGGLDVTRAEASGLTILPKPFQLDQLEKAVEELLARKAAAPENGSARNDAAMVTPEEAPRVQKDSAAEPLGDLRAVLGTVRKAATELEELLGVMETMAREGDQLRALVSERERELRTLRESHEALVREHQATEAALGQVLGDRETVRHEREAAARALSEMREQYQALAQKRLSAADELEAILRRLKG